MLLGIRGSFHITTQDLAEKYTERVMNALIFALQKEKIEAINQSGTTLTYRKAAPLYGYSTNRLAQFAPGEISVRTDGNNIIVRYYLGLEPQYLPTGGLVFILLMLFYFAGDMPFFLPFAVGSSIFWILGTINSIRKIHVWLKSVVTFAIKDTKDASFN